MWSILWTHNPPTLRWSTHESWDVLRWRKDMQATSPTLQWFCLLLHLVYKREKIKVTEKGLVTSSSRCGGSEDVREKSFRRLWQAAAELSCDYWIVGWRLKLYKVPSAPTRGTRLIWLDETWPAVWHSDLAFFEAPSLRGVGQIFSESTCD